MDRRTFLRMGGACTLTQLLISCSKNTPPAAAQLATTPLTAAHLSEEEARSVVTPKRAYKIAALFPFQGIPFWVNEAYGIFDQAAKAGVEVIWRSADGYENVDRQVAQIGEMKALGVNAVLLGATSFAGTRAAVEDLVQFGIPVVNHVTSTDSPRVSSRVLVDYEDIGRRQAQYLIDAPRLSGDVIMLNGPAGAEWSTNEVRGFKKTLANAPELRIVAERNSNPDRVAAQRLVEDLLVRFPTVAACFSVTDSLAMGAVDALRGARKVGTVKVTTAGFSKESVEPIKARAIDLNVDESPVLVGRAALNTAVRVLNGETVPGQQYVPTPEHSAQTLAHQGLENQWAPESWRLP